jgi:hypothetical protein
VNCFDPQSLQLKRSAFGTSPGLGQFWQMPLAVNWLSWQVMQVRRRGSGTSPGLGQFSHLPLEAIWFIAHISEQSSPANPGLQEQLPSFELQVP